MQIASAVTDSDKSIRYTDRPQGGISLERKRMGRTARGEFPGLSERIRAGMKAKGWTFPQFAEATGVAASTLHGLTKEDPTPDARSLYRIAQAFGCSMEWLLTESESAERRPEETPAALPPPILAAVRLLEGMDDTARRIGVRRLLALVEESAPLTSEDLELLAYHEELGRGSDGGRDAAAGEVRGEAKSGTKG
jgi:transcriptional regulator with XRE-family HTH domain